MNKALIIFIKNLIPGQVKTRLASEIGTENAMLVYKQLLEYTRTIAQQIKADVHTYYSDEIPENDIWNAIGTSNVQSGTNLGERMQNAFNDVLGNYRHAVLIGSDCADLQAADLNDAFDDLQYTDLVIGPARDGGYYLIGMNSLHPSLFNNIEWSTDRVFAETRERILDAQLNFKVLAVRMDIDTKADLEASGIRL